MLAIIFLEYNDLYLSKHLSSRAAAARWRGGDGCSLPATHQNGRSTISNISGNSWDLSSPILRVIGNFTLHWARRSAPPFWGRLDRPHCTNTAICFSIVMAWPWTTKAFLPIHFSARGSVKFTIIEVSMGIESKSFYYRGSLNPTEYIQNIYRIYIEYISIPVKFTKLEVSIGIESKSFYYCGSLNPTVGK